MTHAASRSSTSVRASSVGPLVVGHGRQHEHADQPSSPLVLCIASCCTVFAACRRDRNRSRRREAPDARAQAADAEPADRSAGSCSSSRRSSSSTAWSATAGCWRCCARGTSTTQLAAAIARQRAENARLREEARRLREDPRAIEEIARRELGLIKPGEKVFIIKDVPAAATLSLLGEPPRTQHHRRHERDSRAADAEQRAQSSSRPAAVPAGNAAVAKNSATVNPMPARAADDERRRAT